ncbi:hypothetical protein ACFY1J_33420 [Streptomyces sp. NPDC001406]|uniref:hypothetical protein n=1 Tax=Streptomyces sp. NPDC001406 TaxID=3364572 RepID=UPI00369917BF
MHRATCTAIASPSSTISGRPSPVTGMVVKATVHLIEEEDRRDGMRRVREFCAQRLEPYRVPAQVEIAAAPMQRLGETRWPTQGEHPASVRPWPRRPGSGAVPVGTLRSAPPPVGTFRSARRSSPPPALSTALRPRNFRAARSRHSP